MRLTEERLKRLYLFLFWKRFREFKHVCLAMLIPCAISTGVCKMWLLVLVLLLMLATEGAVQKWDKGCGR